jgi:hypothetical protein
LARFQLFLTLDKGKSALAEHVCYTKHEFAWENSKVNTKLSLWSVNEQILNMNNFIFDSPTIVVNDNDGADMVL